MRTPKPIQHGTEKGYYLEIYRGLKTCDRCRAARNAAKRDYMLRTGRVKYRLVAITDEEREACD